MTGTQTDAGGKPMFSSQESDMMRAYVTERDSTRFDLVPQGFVKLDVSHSNLEQRWHNITFVLGDSVLAAKEKLHRHGGSAVADMQLFLRRGPGDTVAMENEHLALGYYGAQHGMEIFIKDSNPYSMSANGALEDLSLVEKYEMDDETYDKREKSVRVDKRREAAKKAAERAANPPPPREATPDDKKEQWLARFGVGARAQLKVGERRGEVKFFGPIPKTEGSWVGIELDEPHGKHDGKNIFECVKTPNYGVFVRPDNVDVGEFPERDPFDELSDDEV